MRIQILPELMLLLNAFLLLQAAESEAFTSGRKKSQQKKTAAGALSGGVGGGGLQFGRNMQQNEEEAERELDGDLEEANDPNSRLMERIRTLTRPYRRPVKHSNDTIEVHVRSSLYQIVDLDQRNNLATLSAYFDVHWTDAFLPWNSTDFDGITTTFIPLRWIWRPEFYLYHSIQGKTPDYDPSAMVEVRNDGMIRLFVPITSRALCPINVKYFPYDTQNCTFLIGSWSYQSELVRLVIDSHEVFLGDFYDNQEWLLVDARMQNGTMQYLGNESFSMVQIILLLRRQSFYYVFNLVFPTTLVSLVAVIGFHAPINATGRRESKFRLGVMTLLSLSVMLLMLVDEMKFALESIPGQRGSFSDVPLIGVYYMSLILTISIATWTSSVFVHLEKYALRNPSFGSIPKCLRFLSAESIFCCYAPRRVRLNKGDEYKRNKNIRCNHFQSTSMDFSTMVPTELNFTEYQKKEAKVAAGADLSMEPMMISSTSTAPLLGGASAGGGMSSSATGLEAQKLDCKLDLLISLLRELLEVRRELRTKGHLLAHWERVINRLEHCSLYFYLGILALNLVLFMWPELWY